MSEPPLGPSAVERALDLAFYAPFGLALSVVEAMPGLARKGRARLGSQVGLARTVGQLVVRQGYRQFVGLATSRGAFPFAKVPPARTYTVYTAELPTNNGGGTGHHSTVEASPPAPISAIPQVPESPRLSADELAVPSYDSLSASQVVQRLAGLSREEIEAVASYEAASRGRRTILNRAEQLLR